MITVTMRNPKDHKDQIKYYIKPDDHALARAWVKALEEIVDQQLHLEKNYCHMGWPFPDRTIEYLCSLLRRHVEVINKFHYTGIWKQAGLEDHPITDNYVPDQIRWPATYGVGRGKAGWRPKDTVMNRLHNHFEVLQGTVENPSKYYELADEKTKYAIRQLNNICHELESLMLSQWKWECDREWIRPSQITTFFNAKRYPLLDQYRYNFAENGYDRKFGHVYMHWCQIGKTLFEVFRDEGAPELDDATCEAITHLQYYSGEFDVEWGKDVTRYNDCPWHDEEQNKFETWLKDNGYDPADPDLSLGYLPIGKVDIEKSFGTDKRMDIWEALATHLDIYSIEVNGKTAIYDYSWSDIDFEQQQMKSLGYEVD